MKRQRMKQNGFTLIETTVAMLVMMIVGLSATSLFLYSVRYNSGASQRSTAMAVAQQRLEVMRGLDFNDTGLAFGTHTPQTVVIAPVTTGSYTPGSGTGSTSYQIQTQVNPFPSGVAAAAATQKQITIRVTPINGNGSSSWVNQSAVEVVFRRSFNVSGPYKQ